MSIFGFRTRTGQISPIIQTQSAVTIDPDAQAFYDRVTAAGGTLTLTEREAINLLVVGLKSIGVWASMKAIYPMVGGSAASCAQNLKSSSYTGTFTSGWTFSANGVTPNGTSAYMNTNLVPFSQLTNNNLHIAFYSRTQILSGRADMGSSDYSGVPINQYTLGLYYGALSVKLFAAGIDPALRVSSSNNDTLGLCVGSRTSTTSAKLYMDGVLLATNSGTNSNGLSSFSIYLGGQNQNGALVEASAKQCAFASIGDGLNDTQVSNFYTQVQAFQTSLSRNV